MPDPKISFKKSANAEVVSAYTLGVVTDLLSASSNPSCLITSTARSPEEQAQAMYTNLQAPKGVQTQRNLYGKAGDLVIDAYEEALNKGLKKTAILAAMTARIVQVGPANVSRHCADPATLNVIDIAPSSLAHSPAFLMAMETARSKGTISKYFSPGNGDPAFHLEIPQP